MYRGGVGEPGGQEGQGAAGVRDDDFQVSGYGDGAAAGVPYRSAIEASRIMSWTAYRVGEKLSLGPLKDPLEEEAMAHISYVNPATVTDPGLAAIMERARLSGTPRPGLAPEEAARLRASQHVTATT